MELGPQGLGSQGSSAMIGSMAEKNYKIILIFLKVFLLFNMHCEFIKKHEKKINYGSKGNFNKKDKFSKVYIIQGVQEKN